MAAKGTKTWIVTSSKSRHPEMNGQTVEIFKPFSNGMQYPGDPAGSADQTADCRCLLDVNLAGSDKFRKITNEDELFNYYKDYEDAYERASPEVRTIMADYRRGFQNPDYKVVNKYLRTGEATKFEAEEIQHSIDAIDGQMRSLVPENTTMFRTLPKADADRLLAQGGEAWRDSGYTSTSLSEDYAREFYGKLHSASEQMVMVEVRVPAGTRACYLDNFSRAAYNPAQIDFAKAEYEWLLPRSSEFKIVSVTDRRIVVDLVDRQVDNVVDDVAEIVDDLSPQQREALTDWAEGSFQDVQGFLRSGTEPLDLEVDEVQQIIKHMDDAMRPLADDATTYRFAGDDLMEDLLPGDTFVDNGFVSTSRSSAWAQETAPPGSWQITVESPAGTSSVDIAGAAIREDEFELLLARRTKFEVVEINEDLQTAVVRVVDQADAVVDDAARLSSEEIDAFRGYADDFTGGINAELRAGADATADDLLRDAVIARQPPVEQGTRFYRAISEDVDLGANGAEFTDLGYTSTTTDFDVAAEYAEQLGGRVIEVKIGNYDAMRVFNYKDNAELWEEYAGQAEALFPRGTTYKVIKVGDRTILTAMRSETL